jgi:RimJ/RimL family protein N-acetyltransferase
MWSDLTKTLTGKFVSLEPLAPAHESALFEAVDHEGVWQWLPIAQPDRDGFGKVFEFLLAENEADRMGTFVTHSLSGEVLGTSSYLALRPENDGLEIGWTMIDPAAWRTGANVEAKLLMLGHAFGELGCQRVEFKTDARNERSRGALTALPATFEGVFRKHMNTNYGVRDSAYYSVIDDDWPEVKASLEARLKKPTQPAI